MKYLLGLGSNLGDKSTNIQTALKYISAFARIIRSSSLYRNAALLPALAPKSWDEEYINACALIECSYDPMQLLQALQEIERRMGRPQDYVKWSPRIIDIDIILSEIYCAEPGLTIPHPEWRSREFVLKPAQEILGQPLPDLLQNLEA